MRDGVILWPGTEQRMLDLLLTTLQALDRHDVSYCYWKSTRRLSAVLSGESDLDLLIARADRDRAQVALLECGLKLCGSVAGRSHPSIVSFLGYDEPSGRIIHLHVHFRLIVGERLLRNYRLPWEDLLLANVVRHPDLPIWTLSPVHEALLLTARACLELRRLDPLTLRAWQSTLHKFELDRIALAPKIERSALRAEAARLLGDDLADALANATYTQSAFEKLRPLQRAVRKRLAFHRSYNAAESRLRSAGRVAAWLAGGLNKRFLHMPRPWSRLAPGGGSVIAVIGVDGSGKTTVVATVREWLGAELDVIPIYFGTGGGRPSLLLLPLKLLAPIFTRLTAVKPRGSSHGKVSNRAPGPLYSLCLTVWATVLAVEKRRKLQAARRGADRGLVVIADRYPQDELTDFNDGPLLPRLRYVPGWLRRFEANAYALTRRLPPDLVLRLRATPETIATREPEMDRLLIHERTEALGRLTFPTAIVADVDAEQPLADMIRVVKHEIWRRL